MRNFARTAAALVVAAGLAVSAATPASAATYSSGHFDVFDVDYSGGSLTLDIKGYTPANDDINPATTTLAVGANTLTSLGTGLSCLGASSDSVYRLPQSATSDKLYAGWNTEDSTTAVTLQLVSSTVPSGAKFAIYQSGLGSVSYKISTSTLSGCSVASFPIAAAAHAHGYWVFTRPGTYSLTFKATTSAGASSGNVTYTFQVG